jgi:CRP/FNR family cyclic AMP-dependent transcriptional regulator
MPVAKSARKTKNGLGFNVEEYLSNAGASRRVIKYKKGQALFSQDDPCNEVWYIQSGNAKLTIVNPQGKEAVLAILGPGDFLGEGCIIGNPVRIRNLRKSSSITCWSATSRLKPIWSTSYLIPARNASLARC